MMYWGKWSTLFRANLGLCAFFGIVLRLQWFNLFTSNKNPALWREDFNEDSTLLCALDRIFDEATVFKLRGESFRGKKLDTVSVQTGKVKAVELLADQQEE